jgi:DNA-binding transcriptional MerR regulator
VTIDALAATTGTTTRRIRSLQTLGLLPHPVLRGRTGLYDESHRDRLRAILHLQEQGFSLESIGLLFAALDVGRSLASVLGVAQPTASADDVDDDTDSAELYGFAELQRTSPATPRSRALLSVVPTTVWDESEAS